MADQVLTKQKLIDADEDLGDLEEVLNGPPGKLVKTRLGREVYTLASVPQINTMTREEVTAAVAPKANKVDVDTALSNLSTTANKYYSTLAAANADIANIALNQSVTIGEEANSGLWEKKTAGATTLTKSAYDPLTQAKDFANANPMFKQVAVVAGNNTNNFTTSGMYTLSANLVSGQLTNWPQDNAGYHQAGVIFVQGITIGAVKLATQIFFPYINAYEIKVRRQILSNGTWEAGWDSLTLNSKKFDTITITSGQDVFTLPQGRYNIPSIVIGNSLLNMPNVSYKFGVIDVDVFTGYRIVKFTPYGRDTSVYINASYEAGVWSGWQQYTPNTSGQLNALLKALTKTDYFGKQYSASELTGTTLYTSAYYAGYNSISGGDGVSFNAIKARIFNSQGGEIQYRVYTGSAVSTGAFGYSVTAANQANYLLSGICKNFPSSDTGEAQTIELDKVVSIPPNTPFVIVFRRTDLRTFGIGQHTAVSGNLENRGFNLIASAVDWGVSNLANGSTPAFTQSGFQLLLNIEAGGGSTPEPEVYTPELVLPPKIYASPNYDCNVYLEHLTLEDHDLYNFDITCTKGWHRKRGWWWKFKADGTEAGTYPITVSSHDKQSGKQLAVASGNVICPSPSAKSGAINILTIGDSLLAAGAITQQLLDMSVSDVMKVNLIGTRGTGLNKHEGRGGWTINDYTTAGRTYYQFTVSGVTELPAINATTYTVGSSVLMVQEVAISSGSGTILCNLVSGSAPTGNGTLTKSNAASGDSTIAFSAVTAASGNPFWNGSAVNFANYLSVNSFSAPDIVFIQLGVNDTFGLTSDSAVESFTTTAFANLDTLINSIKAVNATIKVAVCAPPVYASQDAFGENYACGQTAWRAKRNIVTYNKKLYERYKNQEASRVYVVGSGVSVDTLNNFPYAIRPVNAFNTDTVYMQTNAVHPAKAGYQQIGVTWFAAAKAI